MRVVIGKKNSSEKTTWEHPRTKRIRQSDIYFLRFLLILTLIATIYLGPVKYILLNHPKEASGTLNETYVEAYRNRHAYKPNHILHLRIGEHWYQVLQRHSKDDIRNIRLTLSAAEGKEVSFEYVDTLEGEGYLTQIRCEEKDFLSNEYFVQAWTKESITNSIHGIAVILICIIVYLFRCGYIKAYRDKKP